MSILKSS